MHNFTPGKWLYNGFDVIAVDEKTSTFREIACLYHYGQNSETDANSRLMASAPDLKKLLFQALGVTPSNNDKLINDIAELLNYIEGR